MQLDTEGSNSRVRVVLGSDAERLLVDQEFVTRWQAAFDGCPWATTFQSPDFTRTWYDCYRADYEPVLVLSGTLFGANADDDTADLLCLTRRRSNGALFPAGTHHAEYQACVSAGDGDAFMAEAVVALEDRFPRFSLSFKYAPRGAPLGWVRSCALADRIIVEETQRPLLSVADSDRLDRFIRKKKRLRTKLNKLKRLGTVRYQRIRTRDELEPLMDSIATLCDLRHAAVHATRPFADDAHKREFHLALLDRGLLHSVALFLDDELIAAHLGGCGRRAAHLGVIVHSPRYGRHSPGAHLIFEIARELSAESFETFDLTPGGDAYKSRFASDFDQVHTIDIKPSAMHVRLQSLRGQLWHVARSAISKVGLEPRAVKAAAQRVLKLNWRRAPAAALRSASNWIRSETEFRVYRMRASDVRNHSETPMARDRLENLLRFRVRFKYQSQREFLSAALRRIENGTHCYTFVEGDHLLHYGWLIERQTRAHFAEVNSDFEYPECSAVLYDFYTDPDARGRGLYQSALRQIVVDAAAIPNTRNVFISVLADNAPRRHVIEKVGFQHYASVVRRMRFGVETHAITHVKGA